MHIRMHLTKRPSHRATPRTAPRHTSPPLDSTSATIPPPLHRPRARSLIKAQPFHLSLIHISEPTRRS
eukprot:5318770-Prymnesium_polylepis.2